MKLIDLLKDLPGFNGLEQAWEAVSRKLEALEHEVAVLKEHVENELGPAYVPEEYPKLLANGKTVHSAAEEAKELGTDKETEE